MQTEFKQINATSEEIILTVETERVDAAYQKYQLKSAKQLEVPGFRKGKAPLQMVTRMYGEKIKDYFEKDFVDEVFAEAVREHDIKFLLYPEVKEIQWEQGSEMKITLEIEHEPELEFKQLENLRVQFLPLVLEQEVEKFIQHLASEHATIQDVDAAAEGDSVAGLLSFELDGAAQTLEASLKAGDLQAEHYPAKLIGARTGDKFEADLDGLTIKMSADLPEQLEPDEEHQYACVLEISSITRSVVPSIDDEFAKDMDFADLDEMKAKIADDLKARVEHTNIDGEHTAILAKLYTDNPFQLPPKTLRYIASQELNQIDERYRQMLQQYVIEKVMKDMTTMYIGQALHKQAGQELTDEMIDSYVEHQAILSDMTPGAFREKRGEIIEGEDFRDSALIYQILRGIAATSEFVEPEPEAETPEEKTDATEEEA